MPSTIFLRALALAKLACLCHAWLQVPLVIINMSPWEASIDMDGGERCWSHAAGKHTDLNHYYDSWLSDNLVHDFDKDETESDYTALNMYLQTYKSVWGVPKLRGYTEPMSGTKKLPGLTPVVDGRNVTAAPMAVFEGETDNGVFNGCGTKDRYKWVSHKYVEESD